MPRKSVPFYRLHKASGQAPSPFTRQPVSSQTTRGRRLISRDGKEEQARLENDRWQGYADLLFKFDVPSKLGACSSEVADTKLPKRRRQGQSFSSRSTLKSSGRYKDTRTYKDNNGDLQDSTSFSRDDQNRWLKSSSGPVTSTPLLWRRPVANCWFRRPGVECHPVVRS